MHGTEPPDKPPLLRAGSVVVGLKLVSILRKDVDIQSLTVSDPRVYLIIGSDGRTNFPEPKVRRTGKNTTVEDILKLAIGRFSLERGLFEVEARSRTPFTARGENLNVRLAYDLLGPRYRGTVAIQPLYLNYDDYGPTPFAVNLAVTMEKNRIAVDSGTLATGATRVDVNGALEDLNAPRAHIQYRASVALTDVARIVRVPQLRNGRALVDGTGEWTPASGVALSGKLHATGVEYRDNTLRLVDFRGDGAVSASAKGVTAEGLRISGFYARGAKREAVQGQVGSFSLRDKDIEDRRRGVEFAERIFPRQGAAASTGALLGDGRSERSGHAARDRTVQQRAVAVGRPGVRRRDAGRLLETRQGPSRRRQSHARAGAFGRSRCTANSTWRTTPAAARWTWDGPRSACRTRG